MRLSFVSSFPLLERRFHFRSSDSRRGLPLSFEALGLPRALGTHTVPASTRLSGSGDVHGCTRVLQ